MSNGHGNGNGNHHLHPKAIGGRIFDLPPQTVQRYLVDKTTAPFAVWRPNNKVRDIPSGKDLRVEDLQPFTLAWTTDDWKTRASTQAADTGLGVYFVDVGAAGLAAGSSLDFRFYMQDSNQSEEISYEVNIIK